MIRVIIAVILSIISFIGTVMNLISVTGVSTSESTLQKYSWVEAVSDGTVMGTGKIFAGTNAFYITGEDSDVLKYSDCTDVFEFCDVCGSSSSSTTFLMSFTFLLSFITLCLTWASICYQSNDVRRGVSSFITFVFGVITYTTYEKCYQSMKNSDGITSSIHYSRGYDCLLYGFILFLVVCVTSALQWYLDENLECCKKRSTAVYATNQEFEFEDIENDPEFQANLD